jgi:hypothetical protein
MVPISVQPVASSVVLVTEVTFDVDAGPPVVIKAKRRSPTAAEVVGNAKVVDVIVVVPVPLTVAQLILDHVTLLSYEIRKVTRFHGPPFHY